MTTRRQKDSQKRPIFPVTRSGQCVSVDQMVSREARFIAQLKGKLTTGRYTIVTVFVDHYSRLRYIYLQRQATSAETLLAKMAFETFSKLHGVHISH